MSVADVLLIIIWLSFGVGEALGDDKKHGFSRSKWNKLFTFVILTLIGPILSMISIGYYLGNDEE